jgi:hypothetical protein
MIRKYKLSAEYSDYTVEAATAKILMRGGLQRAADIAREVYGNPELKAGRGKCTSVYKALKSLRFQKLAIQTGEHWSWL